MRNFGSFLIILLIITAYGRCVADQFGALHTSNTACCQTVCCDDDHCESSKTVEPDEAEETESSESHSDHNHTPVTEPEDPDQPSESDPCQLCLILSNDSMLLSDSIKVPSPTLLEIAPLYFTTTWTWNSQFPKHLPTLDLEQLPDEHPDRPAEHRSQLRRIIAKTTPVRGPSIV